MGPEHKTLNDNIQVETEEGPPRQFVFALQNYLAIANQDGRNKLQNATIRNTNSNYIDNVNYKTITSPNWTRKKYDPILAAVSEYERSPDSALEQHSSSSPKHRIKQNKFTIIIILSMFLQLLMEVQTSNNIIQ